MIRRGDRSKIGIVKGDDLQGPVFSFAAASNVFSPAKNLNSQVSDISLDTMGSTFLVAQGFFTPATYVLDANLNLNGTILGGRFGNAVDATGVVGYRVGTAGIDILDLSNFVTIGTLALPDTVTAVPFSPRGRMAISANGTLLAVITNHGFSIVRTGFNVSIVKTGTGSGTVTSSPAGIDCGTTYTGSFSNGTVLTLTATPATDSVFVGFSRGCLGGTITLTADKNCTAVFDLR